MLGGFDWTVGSEHNSSTQDLVQSAILEDQIPNVDVIFMNCGHGCHQPMLDAAAKTVTEAQLERSAGLQDASVLVLVFVESL